MPRLIDRNPPKRPRNRLSWGASLCAYHAAEGTPNEGCGSLRNAAAITSVNGDIAKLQQDITAANAAAAAMQTQINIARAELATLLTRKTNLQNEITALNAEIEAIKGNGKQSKS